MPEMLHIGIWSRDTDATVVLLPGVQYPPAAVTHGAPLPPVQHLNPAPAGTAAAHQAHALAAHTWGRTIAFTNSDYRLISCSTPVM